MPPSDEARLNEFNALDLVGTPRPDPFRRSRAQFFLYCGIVETAADHYKVVGTVPLQYGVFVVHIYVKVEILCHFFGKLSCTACPMIEDGKLIVVQV